MIFLNLQRQYYPRRLYRSDFLAHEYNIGYEKENHSNSQEIHDIGRDQQKTLHELKRP